MFFQTPNSSHCKFCTCQKWVPASCKGDFENFLNVFEWMQFVLQNCEKLHSAFQGLYDSKTAPHGMYCLPQMWCITEKYKNLLYAPPDLLARFCKVNVLNIKKFGLSFYFGLPNATYRLRVNWLPLRTIMSSNQPL